MEALRIGALRSPALVVGATLVAGGCVFGGTAITTDRPDPGVSAALGSPAQPSALGTSVPLSSGQTHTVAPASPRPLPACAYLDEPVLGDPATDWATLVLDTVFALPEDFVPARLVSTRRAGLNGGFKVSRVMLDDLTAMADDALADGAGLAVQSAYRSHAYQVRTFQGWVERSSEEEARKVSARPGHSEHQLGTALDLRSADDATAPWEFDDWATTRAGAWLGEHAWEHGFVMSYPKGKRGQTCYSYEPWHYRYVGRDVAEAIHESGLTPRRYLWETYWAGP